MAPKTAYQRGQTRQQVRWKHSTADLPEDARRKGRWEQHACDFILPIEHASQNLWAPIRSEVLSCFLRDEIAFHEEESTSYGPRLGRGPSPHLRDSQIAALNFWWPLQATPSVLAAVLRKAIPQVVRMVPPVSDGRLLEFEWIGLANHLGEKGARRRGKFATSADVLLAYEDVAGRRHGVLLESKYTEAYEVDAWTHRSPRGTDRVAIYRGGWDLPDSPFLSEVKLEDLFVDPFDQQLRQQLLAAAMERSGELGFSTVMCLHVAPNANVEFHQRVTSPTLRARGATVGEVWASLLRRPELCATLSYELAFQTAREDPSLQAWANYQRDRYAWGA